MAGGRQAVGFRRVVLAALLVGVAWGAAGCDPFSFSPHQVRFSESERDLTRKNLERIRGLPQEETFKIAVFGDTQGRMTETEDGVEALDERDDVSFAIQVGDLTDFGFTKEFRWTQRLLAEIDVPVLTVIGNHDHLGNGSELYEAMYGPLNHSFFFGRTKFVFLDDNSREHGFDGTVPDLGWLRRELPDDGSYDRAVVVSHVPPTDPDFDPALKDGFVEALRRGGAVLSLHGHVHDFSDDIPFDDGVRYVTADGMEGRNFLVVTIGPGRVEVEQVFF
ncbi:MAG TPA: metallophosphoesterase [Vulgatibacter sp.]|nr:metallophosphoesterase [Vulgatibacter sp.]